MGVSLCELGPRAGLLHLLLANAAWPAGGALAGREGAGTRRARCSSCTTALIALCVMLDAAVVATEGKG